MRTKAKAKPGTPPINDILDGETIRIQYDGKYRSYGTEAMAKYKDVLITEAEANAPAPKKAKETKSEPEAVQEI
jgi:endonuclease YncB( thermonuclease family)